MDFVLLLLYLGTTIIIAKLILISVRRWRKSPRFLSQHTKQCLQSFESLYKNIDGRQISLNERERFTTQDSSFVYGEIIPLSFAQLLESLSPHPEDVFYDLGSGVGKAVLCAALFFEWRKCCGVELMPGLHECSQSLLAELPARPFPVEFLREDFLQVDLSDASVIFLHATTFAPTLWENLKKKLYALKSGTRLIVVTKRLDESVFELISEWIVRMSWGESSAFIYRKR